MRSPLHFFLVGGGCCIYMKWVLIFLLDKFLYFLYPFVGVGDGVKLVYSYFLEDLIIFAKVTWVCSFPYIFIKLTYCRITFLLLRGFFSFCRILQRVHLLFRLRFSRSVQISGGIKVNDTENMRLNQWTIL